MRILEIKLLSNDLLETEKFYSEMLGLKLFSKNKNLISFKAGSSKLSFIKSEKINPTYHFAFNIPNNKLQQAITWAYNRVNLIPIEDEEVIADFKNWNAKSIYFYDTNKNILEFIARYDLDNSIDGEFTVESIQSISEISLIDDDPGKLAEELIQKYDFSYFKKGAQVESFKTLGTDEGLIIIVHSNHDWYPTKQKVERNFLEIALEVNGRTIHLNMD